MRAAVADVSAIVLSAPLITSLVLGGWAGLWGRSVAGPLPSRTHRLLTGVQAAVVVLLLLSVPDRVAFGAAAALYVVLGGGAAVLLITRGSVPCGCWGAGRSPLSWRLVAGDVLLGLGALGVAAAGAQRSLSAVDGVLVLLSVAALSFTFASVVPDARHALVGVRARAQDSIRWFEDFPDLEKA
jgi:hypothetical protein